jgi:hypothetical protein
LHERCDLTWLTSHERLLSTVPSNLGVGRLTLVNVKAQLTAFIAQRSTATFPKWLAA